MTSREKLVSAIFESMMTLRRLMMKEMAQVHDAKDLPTHAQTGIMMTLFQEGTMGVKELAAAFRMTSSAATQLVTTMVAKGWIVREDVLHDRRKVALKLSARGEELVKELMKKRAEHFAERLSALTDKELQSLQSLQEKMIASHPYAKSS